MRGSRLRHRGYASGDAREPQSEYGGYVGTAYVRGNLATHIAPPNKKIEASSKAARELQKQVNDMQKKNDRNCEMIVEANMQRKKDMDHIQKLLKDLKCITDQPDSKRTRTSNMSAGSSSDIGGGTHDGQEPNTAPSTSCAQPVRGRYYTSKPAPQSPDDEEERTRLLRFLDKVHLEHMLGIYKLLVTRYIHVEHRGSMFHTIGNGGRHFGIVFSTRETAQHFMDAHRADPYHYDLDWERISLRVTPVSQPDRRERGWQAENVYGIPDKDDRSGKLQTTFPHSGPPRAVISLEHDTGRMTDLVILHYGVRADEQKITLVEFLGDDLCAAEVVLDQIRRAVGVRPGFPPSGDDSMGQQAPGTAAS